MLEVSSIEGKMTRDTSSASLASETEAAAMLWGHVSAVASLGRDRRLCTLWLCHIQLTRRQVVLFSL
jgi:hypothetical protein